MDFIVDMGAYEYPGIPLPIIDSFVAFPTSGEVPLTVTFTCEAHDFGGSINTYTLDHGDGTSQDNITGLFSYEYVTAGTYDATCTVVDNDGDSNTSEPVRITVNKIIVISPNGGEELSAGETFEITWAYEGNIENVKIEYSVNNGTDWIEIIESTENDGSYIWDVPCDLSDESLIGISDVDGDAYDESDEVFSIEDLDSDGDGTPDCLDSCPADPNKIDPGVTFQYQRQPRLQDPWQADSPYFPC
jgi:PKD repeat protein